MSDMQAVKVQLLEVPTREALKHRDNLAEFDELEDEDEIAKYCTKHKIKVLGDVVYRYYLEELDPYGFSTKTVGDDGVIEIVALWYNGGAYIDEVLEEALNKDE